MRLADAKKMVEEIVKAMQVWPQILTRVLSAF